MYLYLDFTQRFLSFTKYLKCCRLSACPFFLKWSPQQMQSNFTMFTPHILPYGQFRITNGVKDDSIKILLIVFGSSL